MAPGPVELTAQLLWSFAGGIAAGLDTGGAVVLVRRRLDDPLRKGGLSILTPFLAVLPAQIVRAGGVMARPAVRRPKGGPGPVTHRGVRLLDLAQFMLKQPVRPRRPPRGAAYPPGRLEDPYGSGWAGFRGAVPMSLADGRPYEERDLRPSMDIEEIRLLGPAPSD